jgi:predicted O-methyltransferase YrrM
MPQCHLSRKCLELAYLCIQADSRLLKFALSSDVYTGCLLATLAASKPNGNLLEIGTGTGHGTA